MLYTTEQAIAIAGKVIEIANARPNARYLASHKVGGCSYSTGRVSCDGCTSDGGCLIGQAITALGYPLPHNDSGIRNHLKTWGHLVADFLQAVQSHQDDGKPWGEAVSEALTQTGYTPE